MLKLSANVKKQQQQLSSFYKSGSRKDRPSFHSESDAYGIDIAPFSLFESQVMPVYVHNLYKLFRQILATIRVLSLGTKFIPKWNMRNKKKALTEFKNFRRQRNDKAFFMEKLQALLSKIKSFERQNYFIPPVEDTDINSF